MAKLLNMDIQNKTGGVIFLASQVVGGIVKGASTHAERLEIIEHYILIASYSFGALAAIFLALHNGWKFFNRKKIAQSESQSRMQRDYPVEDQSINAIWPPAKGSGRRNKRRRNTDRR